MKILYIAPIPPPITGHSLVSKIFLDDLLETCEVETVNLSKDSFKSGINSFRRILQVLEIIKEIWSKKNKSKVIYLTISQSFAGNVKDLFIYLVCYRNLSGFYIHLHGGSIKRLLWDKHKFLAKINRFFLKKLAGAIISGKSHLPIFTNILPPEKIHIVPNFAQDYLFVDAKDIEQNFSNTVPIRILYMSNLIKKKGYNELADAFIRSSDSVKRMIQIDFAGSFDSEDDKNTFLDKIKGFQQLRYHGIVNDQQKRELFSMAHIFCLPTSYFEGQPISILEAYASGCVVLTTGQSGILDIFQDKLNGFEIEASSESIKQVIDKIIYDKDELVSIALANRAIAYKQYRTSIYINSIKKILESSANATIKNQIF